MTNQRQRESQGLAPRGTRWASDAAIVVALAVAGGLSSIALGRGGPALCRMIALPGGLQWFSGIHVLPLILVAGLVRRPGAATAAGVLKGVVELLAGSSHAGLVIAYAGVAGLIVDLVFIAIRRRERVGANLVAGGLATASNVAVQACSAGLAGACPATMSYLPVAAIALVSGVVLAGWPGWLLVRALRGLWGAQRVAAVPGTRTA